MTYERFLKITTTLKMQDERVSELYERNVDLVEFTDPYHQAITELIKEIYGEEGYDWWAWFCYESDYGTKYWGGKPVYKKNEDGELELITDYPKEHNWGASDENGNPICHSFLSTWEYLEANHKK